MKFMPIPYESMSQNDREELRSSLDQFYLQTEDYGAFKEPFQYPESWGQVGQEILACLQIKPPGEVVRVLEVGAGRTQFRRFLESQLPAKSLECVELHLQDVTPQNLDWLTGECAKVWVGDVSSIKTEVGFDVIFSTYVWEHVTDPPVHLESLWSNLNTGGVIMLFSPKYELPGYLCPSVRHLSRAKKTGILISRMAYQIKASVKRSPAFLIQRDLAVFHQPFYYDADACHWVSELDLKLWSSARGARLRKLRVPNAVIGSRDWVVKNFCSLAMLIQKTEH